jgi:predicted esterase
MFHRGSARASRVRVGVCLLFVGLGGLFAAEAGVAHARSSASSTGRAPCAQAPCDAAGEPAPRDRVDAAPDFSGAAELAEHGRQPIRLSSNRRGQPPILAVPPRPGDGKRKVVLLLHGMCDSPENECPELVSEATRDRWLVCPRANLACDGGGTIWSGLPKQRTELVETALARMAAAFPERVDIEHDVVLAGFSLGSFVALDVAQRSRGRFAKVLLIGAKIYPDARLLRQAGVESILLAAGDRDMMKWHMVEQARRLERRGTRAKFIGLGNVGHWFAADMNAWLGDAIGWLDGARDG